MNPQKNFRSRIIISKDPRGSNLKIKKLLETPQPKEIYPTMGYEYHTLLEDDPNKYGINIGFLIIATGKYTKFVQPLIDSIEKYFLPRNSKYYNIFSEQDISLIGEINYQILKIDHKPFPYPTLNRFHFFEKYKKEIIGDQIIYIDADTLIKNPIGTEVINPSTVVQHCGFLDKYGSFEKNRSSRCYIEPGHGKNYYGGGFYSYSRDNFFDLSSTCKEWIDADGRNGIIPIWHDESALNKYVLLHPADRILSPSYHYPENRPGIYRSWGGANKFECRILLLDKNHEEIRG